MLQRENKSWMQAGKNETLEKTKSMSERNGSALKWVTLYMNDWWLIIRNEKKEETRWVWLRVYVLEGVRKQQGPRTVQILILVTSTDVDPSLKQSYSSCKYKGQTIMLLYTEYRQTSWGIRVMDRCQSKRRRGQSERRNYEITKIENGAPPTSQIARI